MTFSQEIKNEIANLKLSKKQNLIKSELLGFAISNATTLNDSYIRFLSENIDIIERYKYIIKRLTSIDIIESQIENRLNEEKNLFELYIDDLQERKSIYDVLGIKSNNYKDIDINVNIFFQEEKIAFLRGVFLGSGYVCNPKSEYHLEIILDNERNANLVKQILEDFELSSKMIIRNKQSVIYLKNSDLISDFIGMIGSSIGVIHFEEQRVIKEMNNNINRVINCETANLNKAILNSQKQIEDIQLIKQKGKYDLLNDKLKQVCEARAENPELSLNELANLIGISKSGLNNRLKKIKEIANS